jgi:hypothetical protein
MQPGPLEIPTCLFTVAQFQSLGHVSLKAEASENMIGLAEETLAGLENLARELRGMISRDPQHSRAELGDVEWEIEKRRWRKGERPHSNEEVAKDDPSAL